MNIQDSRIFKESSFSKKQLTTFVILLIDEQVFNLNQIFFYKTIIYKDILYLVRNNKFKKERKKVDFLDEEI